MNGHMHIDLLIYQKVKKTIKLYKEEFQFSGLILPFLKQYSLRK